MTDEPGHGVRIMVITEYTEFDMSDSKSAELYDSIVALAVDKLKETKPLFALRYNKVCEDNLPMQYAYSLSGGKTPERGNATRPGSKPLTKSPSECGRKTANSSSTTISLKTPQAASSEGLSLCLCSTQGSPKRCQTAARRLKPKPRHDFAAGKLAGAPILSEHNNSQ